MGDEDKKIEITAENREYLKDIVEGVLDKVELGGVATAYEACFAEKNNSALSFGRGQHDIGFKPENPLENQQKITNFKNILQHEGVTEQRINVIMEVGQKQGLKKSEFVEKVGGKEGLDSINAALNSPYGRKIIDEMDKGLINANTQNLVELVEAAHQNPHGPGVLGLDILDPRTLGWAAAWDNSSGGLGTFKKYVRGEPVTFDGKTHQLKGALTWEDGDLYFSRNKEFRNEPVRRKTVDGKIGQVAEIAIIKRELRQAEDAFYQGNVTGSVELTLGKEVLQLREKLGVLTDPSKPYVPNEISKKTNVNAGSNHTSPLRDGTYQVQQGDTFSQIAATNKTSINKLAEVNGIKIKDVDKISVGQVLTLPGREILKSAVSEENIKAFIEKTNAVQSINEIKGQINKVFEKVKPLAPLLAPVPLHLSAPLVNVKSPTSNQIVHEIKAGENLSKIATLYKTTPELIQQQNRSKIQDRNKIKAGDKIYIQKSSSSYQADPSPLSIQVTTQNKNNMKLSNQMPNWQDGIAIDKGNWKITLNPKILNSDGLTHVAPSAIITDSLRPGGQEISTFNYSNIYTKPTLQSNIEFTKTGALNFTITTSRANNFQGNAHKILNIDPLILDLNGDGVQLVDYHHSNVLFNVDKDSEKEITGWATSGDGFLVHDRNQDGQINDISEMISEYYVSGVKDSFEALATLDSNKDSVFDAKDPTFDSLRVWVDSNQNGQTEPEELKKLSDHNIQSISLRARKTNGRVLVGNEIVAKGTMVKDGKDHEVLSVQFLSDEAGHTVQSSSSGHLITSEAQIKSFLAQGTGGSVLNLSEGFVVNEDGEKKDLPKDINSVYGSEGDDTLTGDDKDNWLAGNGGSDIIQAGGGNDVLIVDAEDIQENIDGGQGFDILHVVGDRGVTLNLARIGVEVAHGGRGDDWFEGGGKSTVYVRGGQGNDVIFGSIAGDALSGEEDDDYIDGGEGNDLIRGHIGNDILLGNDGDDILDGGWGDDYVMGGIGDDVLIPGGGINFLLGGEGVDLVQLSGNYSDYKIKKKDNYYIVTDTHPNRDGISYIQECEKIQFQNFVGDFNSEAPLPVKDIVAVEENSNGIYKILIPQLTKNDIHFQMGVLSPYWVGEAKGGTVVLNQDHVLFTAAPNYQGILSFRYRIKDQKNNITTVFEDNSTDKLPMTAEVFLKRPNDPNDPLYFDQWYLSAINIQPIWKDYTGKNIKIGINEMNVIDFSHADLIDNLSKKELTNKLGGNEGQSHTHPTLVAGVIAASKNDKGIIGVAYDAQLASDSILLPKKNSSPADKFDPDIINSSWGYADLFYPSTQVREQLKNNAIVGRKGLGSLAIFAAGNNRKKGVNANYNSACNHWYAIVVAALNASQDLSVLKTSKDPFSEEGANILVTAPGSGISSTGMALFNNLGSQFLADYEETSGTSFAAPITSGVVALMLEANPTLGYRDIQHILAASARQIADPKTKWAINGASHWNGGGMHFSHDYGAGLLDAHAAVRLAETWLDSKTYHNALIYQAPEQKTNLTIQDSKTIQASLAVTDKTIPEALRIADSITIEHIEVMLDLEHQQLGDLVVSLVSPSGTESILMNRPGKVPGSADADQGMGEQKLRYSFQSTQHLGEASSGVWTLNIRDAMGNQRTGVLKSWSLSFIGSPRSLTKEPTKTLIYTNEYALLGQDPKRRMVHEPNAPIALNASSMTSDLKINLTTKLGIIADHALTISNQTDIHTIIGGDGNDELIGGSKDVLLYGGRGNDVLKGGQGSDLLVAGPGVNVLEGKQESDYFIIGNHIGAQHTVKDFSVTDNIVFYGFGSDFNKEHVQYTQKGKNAEIIYLDQKIIFENFNVKDFSSAHFTFLPKQNTGLDYLVKNIDKTKLIDKNKLDLIYDDILYVDGGFAPISGGSGPDYFVIMYNENANGETIRQGNQFVRPAVITDFDPIDPREKIDLTAFKNVLSINDLKFDNQSAVSRDSRGVTIFEALSVTIPLGQNKQQVFFLKNVTQNQMKSDHFVFYKSSAPVEAPLVQQSQPLSADSDFFVVTADTSLKIPAADLLKNDKSPNKLAITAVQENGYCDVALEKDGSICLTPNKGFKGWARFQYTVEDTLGAKAVGDVAVLVKEARQLAFNSNR